MGPRVSGRGRGVTGGGLAALLLVMELKLRPLEARPPPPRPPLQSKGIQEGASRDLICTSCVGFHPRGVGTLLGRGLSNNHY